MNYQIRCTGGSGSTFLIRDVFATRGQAEEIRDSWERWGGGCFKYTVEEVPDAPEPTSATQRLIGLLRDRHIQGRAKYGTTLDRADLSPEQWAQHAIEEALDLAGYLMRLKDGLAPEPGSTAAHHVEILRERVKELEEEFATVTANLAKAPSVPVGASEAPGDGGDSDRRRLEALERWLKVDTYRLVYFASRGAMVAMSNSIEEEDVEAPTLAALADKLAEKEDKP